MTIDQLNQLGGIFWTIAVCRSSLDALIAAQTEKLYALKTHKKGPLQQLFPAEAEAQQ